MNRPPCVTKSVSCDLGEVVFGVLLINRQWRICFHWTDAGPEDVEITDYH